MDESANFAYSRLRLVMSIASIAFLLLALRLFQKQVLQHDQYKALAEKQYTIEENVPAKRGQILAVDNWSNQQYFPVATNLSMYSVMAIPRNIQDKAGTASKLAPLISMPEKDIYDQINNNKPYIPALQKKVDYQTAKQIDDLKLRGIYLQAGEQRYYPENELFSHLLGYVDTEQKGKYGLEGYYDSELSGKAGSSVTNTDNAVDSLNPTSSGVVNGSDLYLTIDRNIQYQANKLLNEAITKNGATGGTIIVQDPMTGGILAMVSSPNYNPNDYSKVDSVAVFNNPAVASVYEPGSVFKVITMAAAIDKAVVEPDTTGVFGSSVKVQSYEIKTSTGKAYGKETMTQVLQNSDNVAAVWVEQKLGNPTFDDYIKNFGFSQKTGIDLDTEELGQLLPIKQWRPIHGATISFGQGIAVTPLQLVSAISAIANQGKLMKPYVVTQIKNPNQPNPIKIEPQQVRQVISPDTAAKLAQMMVAVVDLGHGKPAQIKGYSVAGKTGTAQIANPSGSGYLENQNIGSFAGFFPASSPKVAMLVKIDRPKNVDWAEQSATPYFGQLADWLTKYYQIPPDR